MYVLYMYLVQFCFYLLLIDVRCFISVSMASFLANTIIKKMNWAEEEFFWSVGP